MRSILPGPESDVILAIAYAVVVFSIRVQGLTVEKKIKRTCSEIAEDMKKQVEHEGEKTID